MKNDEITKQIKEKLDIIRKAIVVKFYHNDPESIYGNFNEIKTLLDKINNNDDYIYAPKTEALRRQEKLDSERTDRENIRKDNELRRKRAKLLKFTGYDGTEPEFHPDGNIMTINGVMKKFEKKKFEKTEKDMLVDAIDALGEIIYSIDCYLVKTIDDYTGQNFKYYTESLNKYKDELDSKR